MGTIPFGVARAMPPPSTPARRAAPRSSLVSLRAVPSPSAASSSPTSCRPVPPSASLAAPRNLAEREALAERYYPCAFCDKEQGSGDGCRLWHLNASQCGCLDMVSRKRALVTVLFTMFSDHDLGNSFAVLLNFSNFRNFHNYVSQCFANFRKSCFASFVNTSFARFRKYEFHSFTFVSQDLQGFAKTSLVVFASIRKYKFRKISQIWVSQFYVCFARFARFCKYEFLQAFANTTFARFRK